MRSFIFTTIASASLGGAALGQVYNASTEFSPTVNPTGVWSYGLQPGGGGSFQAFVHTLSAYNLDFWDRDLPYPDAYPKVGHNGTDQTQYWGSTAGPVAAGEMVMHPGFVPVVLRFTAPATDLYRYIVQVRRSTSECGPGGNTNALVYAGATLQDSGAFNGFAAQWFSTRTVFRLAGQTIDLAIDYGGDAIVCDQVAASFVVASASCGRADIGSTGGVPEPDGALDNNDFIVFIDWFFAADVRADRGTTGGVAGSDGVFDNNDFIVFIDQFFTGC